jgi:hypothetical protein
MEFLVEIKNAIMVAILDVLSIACLIVAIPVKIK